MLAQNFRTPAELLVTDEQFKALCTVLGMLERGEIPHDPNPRDRAHPWPSQAPTAFNLSSWRCGTAACLGGWAEHVGDVQFPSLVTFEKRPDTGLDRLFWPDDFDDEVGFDYRKMLAVTPSQAAIALRSFLTHGQPRWAEALAVYRKERAMLCEECGAHAAIEDGLCRECWCEWQSYMDHLAADDDDEGFDAGEWNNA